MSDTRIKRASYCQYAALPNTDTVHKSYHDTCYGFPVYQNNPLFGRLILEINQAGLSWTTILKKQAHFRRAYDHFDISSIAAYQEKEIRRLMDDPGIIRNRLKITAIIHNARVLLRVIEDNGSFYRWLRKHHPLQPKEWICLFKKTFRFTGSEITKEFLMSTGILAGAHLESCPVYQQILRKRPLFMKSQ